MILNPLDLWRRGVGASAALDAVPMVPLDAAFVTVGAFLAATAEHAFWTDGDQAGPGRSRTG